MTTIVLHVVFLVLLLYSTRHDPEQEDPCGYD
jgi:hypothetical protein